MWESPAGLDMLASFLDEILTRGLITTLTQSYFIKEAFCMAFFLFAINVSGHGRKEGMYYVQLGMWRSDRGCLQ